MAIFAVSDIAAVLIGLCGLLLAGATLALGIWIGSRSPAPVDESRHTRELMQQLSKLAEGLTGDCSNHQRLMVAVSAEIDRIGESSDTADLRRILDELNAANRDLRYRLGEIQTELDGKVQEVETLVSESRTDVLTGLPNRRSFNESILQRISEVGRYGGELSFIILDVDHFKKFNDSYGHLLGDEVLKSVAKVIKDTVRDSDIPTRFGGEEFGVVMPAIGLSDACQAAERLRLAIEQCPVHYEGQALRVSASFGVTQVQPGDHPEYLIERADQALYAAKEGGRNAVWFWNDDQPRPYSKKRTPSSVPDAMQKNVVSLRDSLLAALDK